MNKNHEFYSSLNLGTDATEAQIRGNYKKLSRFLHPDKQQTVNKAHAESAFSRLQYYKDILTNSTTRYIYDNYGETGATLAVKRNNIFTYRISDVQSQIDLDNKMRNLLVKAHFQQMQQEISHRSTLLINLSMSDYLSNNRSFKTTPWNQKLFQTSMVLDEVVKFNLSSRLSADLGCLFQSTESDCACYLTGKLTYRSDLGYTGQCSYQIGQSFSSTYTLSKQIGGISIITQAHLANSQIIPSFAVAKYLNESTFMRLDLTTGNSHSASISVDQTKNKFLKFSHNLQSTPNSAELHSSLAYKLTDQFGIRLGFRVLSKKTKKKHRIFVFPECMFNVKLNSLLSFGYGVEADEHGLSLVTKFRRGDFLLKIPIHLLKHSNPRTFAIGAGIAALAGVLTLAAGKILVSLKGAFSKKNSREYKEAEKYREHLIVLHDLKDGSKQIKNLEKGKKGLVIKKALYGNLRGSVEPGVGNKIIDLTFVLQGAVRESRLFLTQKMLAELSGVFEPCTNPLLYVKFSFGSIQFERIYYSADTIILP